MFIGPLEDTPNAEPEVSANPPEVSKGSKMKIRKYGSDDHLFRKKNKFKKLGLDLDSDTEDKANVYSFAKNI